MSPFALAASAIPLCLLYYLCPGRFQWMLLLASSLLLYAQGGLQPLAFLAGTALAVWGAALLIEHIGAECRASLSAARDRAEKQALRRRAKGRQRGVLLATLVLCFGLLALLKYLPERPLGLLVPLGISFYTFQSTGYLLDVYGGKQAAERNPARFLLFVSFFPQLVQGPIGRYHQLAGQLTQPRRFDVRNLRHGLILMLWGVFKKLVVADRALAVVDTVFGDPSPYGGAVIAVSVLMYSLQQYADFSGGVDMMLGAAQLFGIGLAPNFRRPYFAVSLGDFWRRWHISLGAWMRDYVFYPFALCKPVAGLSRLVKKRLGPAVARALPAALGNILVFLLVGLWHGASMNYVLWGLYNGVILAASALLEPAFKRFGERHARLTASKGFHVARVLRTFFIVNIGWVFDRSPDFRNALSMLARLITQPCLSQLTDGTLLSLGLTRMGFVLLAFCALVIFTVSLLQERGMRIRDTLDALPLPGRWALLYLLIGITLMFSVTGAAQSFIYAMF